MGARIHRSSPSALSPPSASPSSSSSSPSSTTRHRSPLRLHRRQPRLSHRPLPCSPSLLCLSPSSTMVTPLPLPLHLLLRFRLRPSAPITKTEHRRRPLLPLHLTAAAPFLCPLRSPKAIDPMLPFPSPRSLPLLSPRPSQPQLRRSFSAVAIFSDPRGSLSLSVTAVMDLLFPLFLDLTTTSSLLDPTPLLNPIPC